jgi:hypothetical protein
MAKLEGGSTLGASPQLSLLPTATVSPAIARLASIDVNKTTPLEALAILAELKLIG